MAKYKAMTAREYKGALETLKLSQGRAATILGIGLRTSNGYANGDPIPRYIALLLRLIVDHKVPIEQLE